jgi:hypothetical protein
MVKIAARQPLILAIALSLLTTEYPSATVNAQTRLYNPLPLTLNQETPDTLTEKDIPTGQGGFARDYIVNLLTGDQIAIELNSDNFDTIVTLMGADGSTVGENDDGPDGNSNSLLFSKITKSGSYIIRVRAFGETAIGSFTLKVTRLKPS